MTAKELAFVGSAWIVTAGLTYIGIKAYNDHANGLKLSEKISNYLPPTTNDISEDKEYEIVISLDDLKKMGGDVISNENGNVINCDATVIEPSKSTEPKFRDTLRAFRKIISE